jgi:hypothetical protein
MIGKRWFGKDNIQFSQILKGIIITFVFIGFHNRAWCQVKVTADTRETDSILDNPIKVQPQQLDPSNEYDLGNLIGDVLHPNKKPDSISKKSSGIVIIPNIAANPSIGAQIGIKAVAGRKLGNDPNTLLSIAATSASITTKGILYFYINHNIYTAGNKWNLQGNLVAAKSVTPDHGMGIGKSNDGSETQQALANPQRIGRALHSQYYNFRERIYKEIDKGLFVGAGASFDIRRHITQSDTSDLTPFNIYSDEHGFSRDHYMANGLLFDIQYTTRDNQNRAYKGIYANAGFRFNQTWMGSSKNAIQFITDFRKYFSLSQLHPAHVIALWNWGSYILTGAVPYLELPGPAKDPGSRSGRGYSVGYFKGTQYNYSEIEYRFPILNNNFISGVAFMNLQTANDESGTKLFQVWQPGYGAGLRVLLNKATRTNLCLDYAFGKFGCKGFFLGLNETF